MLVPIGEDDAKKDHVPISLPGIPESAPPDARLADYFWYLFCRTLVLRE